MPERQRQRRTVGTCALAGFTLAKGVFYAFDILVNCALSTGHIDSINMFGREQVVARLALLVVGRRSETGTSGGPSEF
eukprot:3967664-Pyramimonas_sp.AAC.1